MNPHPNNLQVAPISRKRAMALQAAGGYVNTGILIVQGLLLIPLYLHFIGAHLYGLWLSSGGILAMLGVLQFGLGNLLIQRIAHAYGQQDFPKAGAYFVNGMFVYLFITSIFIVVGMLLSLGLIELLKVPGGHEKQLMHCFQLAVLATGIGMLNECLRGFAQALLRPFFPTIALAVFRILGIAGTMLLLYREAGLWAIPVGMLITEILVMFSGMIQAAILFRGLHSKVSMDSGIIKEYFHMGGALFVAKLGHALSRESDPLLITLFLRPEVTTAYMVTRRAADIVFQMLSVIYASTLGAFSHLAGQGNDAKTGEVASKLLAIFFVFGLIGFVVYVGMNASFVSLWVGKAFALEQEAILFIGIAFFASSLRNMVLQILNGLGEFNYTSLIIVLEGLGKTLLAALLLYSIGVIGAPLSLVASCCISIIFLGIKLKNRIRLKVTNHDFSKALVVMLVLFGLGESVARLHEPVVSWSVFVLLTGGLILTASIIFTLSNWSMVREFIKVYPVWRH